MLGPRGSYHLDMSVWPYGLDISDELMVDVVATAEGSVIVEVHRPAIYLCDEDLTIRADHSS